MKGVRAKTMQRRETGESGEERARTQRLTAYAQRAFDAGRLAEAERLCLKVLAEDARCGEALNLLGRVLYAAGRLEAAAKMYARAVAAEEKNAVFHGNLGLALQKLGREDEALAEHRRAVTLDPLLAEAESNLGALLQERGEIHAALELFQKALKLKPEDPHAGNNLGAALSDLGEHEKAVECFDLVLAAVPGFAKARWNRALAHLLEGEYAEGWRDFEARWERDERPRTFPRPQWKGEPLKGRPILLHAEQGLGDTIQFLRFVPAVEAAGGRVLLDVQPALKQLAAHVPGVAHLTATGEAIEPFEVQCPLMSLPLALGTTQETVPNQVPYLAAPKDARRRAAKFAWSAVGARVGVVWSGNPRHRRDRFRSIPLKALESLFGLRGLNFYSLQVGPGAAQLAELGALGEAVTDLRPAIGDFSDTAALIEELDLVITVDTAVAHLAGALGRPVWVLVAAAPDWRWMRGRADSPWYPTVRVFRQTRLGDWTPVLDQVREALKEIFG